MQRDKKLIIVLDTSVLLYDKKSLESFENCDVYLPMIVLDELDRFKEAPGLLGENARYVNRYLDDLRLIGRLSDGISISGNTTIRVHVRHTNVHVNDDLDMDYGDNRIIFHAMQIRVEHPDAQVRIVTKDINLRVKADAFGFEAEDYNRDYLTDEPFSGIENVTIDDTIIDEMYKNKCVDTTMFSELDNTFTTFTNNTFVIVRSTSQTKQSALCRWSESDKKLYIIDEKSFKDYNIKPKNKEQKFALWGLTDPKIKLMTITGLAGSGKTFITLVSAISMIEAGLYDRLIITRNIEPVGRDLGYLPGSIDEKMAPWLAPILDNMRYQFKDPAKFETMKEQGLIEIAPLSFIRGRTFVKSFVIVDESQNANIHELKTIVTRLGEDSKIVLIGDTDQIDTPYINKKTNGLSIVAKKMRNSKLTAHIHLSSGVRSDIATEASKIL